MTVRTSSGRSRRNALVVDERTSQRLARVRQSGTSAELAVRACVSALNVRYRLSNRDLPGSPDLANRSRHWAIFVHGCFWHSHAGCSKATVPNRNRDFWVEKFAANRRRDARVTAELRAQDFRVLVVWECETVPASRLRDRLMGFFAAVRCGESHSIVTAARHRARGRRA